MDETEDKLGGPGMIVEIDEAKFGRRKYHRGCLVDGHWVLGGVERGTDNVFLSVVQMQPPYCPSSNIMCCQVPPYTQTSGMPITTCNALVMGTAL